MKMTLGWSRWAGGLVVALLLVSLRLGAQTIAVPESLSTLQNLPVVRVELARLSGEAAAFGLREDLLQQQLVSALRGEQVNAEAWKPGQPSSPILELRVLARKPPGSERYALVMRLVLSELVTPARPIGQLAEFHAVTWEQQILATASSSGSINQIVQALARVFADEWKQENPTP